MPALRKYNITQTREVTVSGTNPLEAANLGDRVLSGEKKPEDQINVSSEIRVTSFEVREEY